MTILLLQAFLLMAASYFLGAFLGCWWRRAFANSQATAEIGSTEAALASAGPAVVSKAAEPARAEPIPVQPRIEYVAAPEGVRDTTRFGRALSGVGSLGEQKSKSVVAEVKAESAAPPANVEVTAARIVVPPAPHPPAAATPAAVQKSAAAAETDTAMTAAAAAAAAMAAAASTAVRKTAADVVPHPAAPVRPAAVPPAIPEIVPAAPVGAPVAAPQRPVAASAGSSGVSAEVRAAPAVPADRQDLKLIRGIDDVTERTFNSQGIWRFAEIARWSAKDVAAANRLLAATNRVQRENWIEQATLLAGGGISDYARRRLRGETVGAKPSAAAVPSKTPVRQVPAVAVLADAVRAPQARATPAASASAAAAAVAAAAASASRGILAQGERRSAPDVSGSRPAAAAATTPVEPPVVAAVDMLQRIRGIDAAIERALVGAGVRTYGSIAKWTAEDVARFEMLVGEEGRIGRENWIEQAQILAGGGATQYSRQRDVGAAQGEAPAGDASSARPSRLSDAIRDNQVRGPRPAGRSDVAGLRSVRSEALRPGLADGGKIGGAGRSQSDVDDLKRIRGIGVLIEKKLNSLGVMTYERIANWTADDIAHVSEALDFRGRIERENWVEQARILWAGGQTEFSRRVDRGEIT